LAILKNSFKNIHLSIHQKQILLKFYLEDLWLNNGRQLDEPSKRTVRLLGCQHVFDPLWYLEEASTRFLLK
jgi:hypothetical protein